MAGYWATGGILAAYLILVWFLGTWMHLQGSQLWIFRAALAFIGLTAAGVFLWFYRRNRRSTESESGSTADVDLIIKEAVRRLRASTLGRGTSIGSLPVIFLLGKTASAKTTTIVHSALDPELLAGHAYQDNNIVQTRVANIWYSREAVFVDPGGDLMSQSSRWKRLVKLVEPGRMSAALHRGQQAPRAAIVCYDCTNFLKPGASETTISDARKLAVRLHEVSQLLGISFPLYILFTKLDQVSFLADFARNLTKEEASQVLGATLPVRSSASGVYAEEETRRLTKSFDELFYSLAEKRLNLLARETDVEKLPGAYEFPRELRKLRTLIVQFLVDLGRPSHLSVNPFLRGFYFSGVRPVIVDDVIQPTAEAEIVGAGFDGGATRIFAGEQARHQQAATPARMAGSRKIPQWVFLTQLFNEVIVRDRVALATSSFSTRISFFRRTALIAIAILGLICATGMVVSYFQNRSLVEEVRTLQTREPTQPPLNQAPSASDLDRLGKTGQLLDMLENNDPPLSDTWGLYVGTKLYPQVCQIYGRDLQQLLLRPTLAELAAELQQLRYLPSAPGASAQEELAYERAYKVLKTYLIGTTEGVHAKEDGTLASDLIAYWPGRESATPSQADVVRKQFARFADRLVRTGGADCFKSAADDSAVSNARSYLKSFSVDKRVYQAMLAYAAKKGKSLDFDSKYADDAADDSYRIDPEYTKAGWTAMDEALKHPERYVSAEDWVLGRASQNQSLVAADTSMLRSRYRQTYIDQWLAFLKHAHFAGYRNEQEVPNKIEKITSARSALFLVLCVTTDNTRVDDKDVADAFNAAGVDPPDCMTQKAVGATNQKYSADLTNLGSCIEKMSGEATPDQKETDRAECQKSAIDAKTSARTLVGSNSGSNVSVNSAVEALLEAPITHSSMANILKAPPVPGAGDLCSAVRHLSDEFPNGTSAFRDLEDIFKPEGLLKQHPVPDKNPNPRYRDFYNRALAVQKALYPDGKSLQMKYTINAIPNTKEQFDLMLGNQTSTRSLTEVGGTKDFLWTGDPQERIQLKVPHQERIVKQGELAVFQFVSENGENGQLGRTSYSFNIRAKQELGHQTTSEQMLQFSIDAGGATVLFQHGGLSTLGCVAKVDQ